MKLETQATTATEQASGQQVAVIDTRLKDYQQIVAALSPTMRIVLLDAASDGLTVIADALSHYSDVTALHLFSHASPASVQLGSNYLNSSTINTSASRSALTGIGNSLVQDGMILLYGCDLAEGSVGQNFVSQFASLTGVTVGASTNTTGAASLDGDWHMEVIATPNGNFLPTHIGMQNTANAIGASLIDYQQSLAGLITATDEVSIATGNDYIHTTPGTTAMAMLGAVELDNGSRVLLQANNKADYYGMANLDYLSVVVIDTIGNKSTIALSGTVATVVNNNGATTNNSSSIQTNDAASIVALRTGGFVVSSYSNDGYGIQLYNNAGVSQSINAPSTYTSSVNPSAKVLASQDGGFVLLWTTTNATTNEVTASYQRYSSSGTLNGSTYSKVFASTTPVIQNAAIDKHGNIAIPVSSNDVYTFSQVLLWNASNVEVGIFNTVYYQSAAVIAPMYGGGFDLFGNDISSGVGNTASSYYVQTLGADGSLGLPVASTIPVTNLRAVELSLSGDYLAVGGSTDTAKLGYFVDGFNPSAGTTTQSIADADKVASVPSLSEDGNVVSAWITSPVTNDNGLVTSGAVSVVTYGTAFTIPVDFPPTIAGTFTTSGALTDKTTIVPFASLTVSDVDSVSGKVRITYNAANGSLSGTGLTGTPGNYVLETSTTSFTTLNSELRALVFTPTENQIVPNNTVQTTFTLTPGDGVRDGRANTATNAIATSINDAPVINNNGSAASANTSAAENQTAVMTFTTSDPDVGQTITYSKSGADAALFTIHPTTGVLTFTTAPNFEIPSDADEDNVYNVTITSSDGLASDSQAIAVTVTNVNENPVISSNGGGATANINAAENQLAVTVVAADDVDAASTIIYSVSGTDAALFDINGSDGSLTFKTNPNFESPTDNGGNNIYNVIVTASDGTLTDTQTLTVTVTNVNDAPTITGLSAADNQTVSTNASPTLIDIASAAIAADEDNANFNGGELRVSFSSGRQAGDTLAIRAGSGVTLSNGLTVASTITIDGQVIGSIAASGTGAGSDNLIVSLTAQATSPRISTLLQNLTFDANDTKGDRILNIRINDGAANSNTASLTITVTTNPTVEISSSAGPLKAGETAVINFQFSETPIGFTESDISVSGGTISNLTVNGGDNKIYTALFTPAADTQTVSGSVSIGVGTFSNADSENNLASTINASLTGDTLAPNVTSIVRAAATPTNATSVDFTITFAETVSGVDIGDFDLTTTNGVTGSVASISGGGNTYTVTVNNLTGEGNLRLDLKSTSTGIVDALSNPIAGGFTSGQSFTFERTAPTVTSILRAQSDNTNAATLTYDVLFSESVSGVDINDFKLYATTSAAGQVASVTGNGSAYTVTVENVSGMGTLRLDLAQQNTDIKDVANNSFSAGFTSGEAYTIDRIAPTVENITRVGNALSNSSNLSYTVTFSETITGLDVTDFTLTTTSSAQGRIASLSGSGNTYVIVVEDVTGDGTIRLDLNDSATGVNDSFSNTVKTGFVTGEVFNIDRLTPDAPGALDLISSSDTGSSNSDNKTTDSSPAISGSAEANATIKIYSGNQLLTSTSAGNDGKWSIANLDLTTGPHTLTATATDSAGNTSLASSALTLEIANPNLISASYDASTGQLLVTSGGLLNGDTIQSEKLSVSGQNGASYTLSSGNFTALSATQFTVTLNAADKLIVNGLLNLNGTRAVDNTLFNLSAASDWDYTVGANSDTSNPITVTNLSTPTISSASYNAETNVLQITGNHLIKRIGSLNDITVSKLNIRGEAGLSYTLSSDDVELINGTSFAITLNPTDQLQVEALFNKNGYSSTGGTTYNLSATDDWNSVIGNIDTSIASASISVSQIAMPSIISAGYDIATGILSVVGTDLKSLGGNANDIISNRLSLVGEGATPYRLTSANVDIVSASTFNISLNNADKAAIHLFLNKDGESSTSGTEYNLIADDNWAAGVDVALDITDNASNPIAVTRVAKPSITSATYKPSTKTIEVSGANFLSFAGVSNDILSNHLQFTGALGDTFTLTDTSNVDIKNGSSFTVTLSASDNLALAALFNKKGTLSSDNTPYNLALLDNWNQGADGSIDIADIFNNPVEVIGVAPVTSNALIKFNEDQTSVLSLSNFAFTDSDANDSLHSILITALPTIGQLTLDGATVSLNQQISASEVSAGKLRFTPLSNGNGKNYDGFGFKVSDGDMLSNDARVSFEVVPVNDPLIGGVTVSGKTNVGQTLFATNNISDADGFTSLTYQWLANDLSIRGAIKSSYLLSSADVGKKITVLVSYLDFGNTFESTSFTTLAAVTDLNKAPSGTVQISGQLIQGQTLVASNNIADPDGLGVIQYQWKADGQNIANGNASTLILTQEQVNKKITVEANYLDGKGNGESVNSNTSTMVQNVNDLPTGNVQITGTALVGQVLTVINTLTDLDGIGVMRYQWLADGAAIRGAMSSAYVLRDRDIGKTITVAVSYTDSFNTPEKVTSLPTDIIRSSLLIPKSIVTAQAPAPMQLGMIESAIDSMWERAEQSSDHLDQYFSPAWPKAQNVEFGSPTLIGIANHNELTTFF